MADVVEQKTREHYGWLWTQPEHFLSLDGIQAMITRVFGDVSGKTVLDCGSGTGLRALAFSRLGAARVVGLDFSPLCVERGQAFAREAKATNVEFLQADLLQPLPVGRDFDIVHSHGVLHHTMDCRRAFDNISGHVRRPGGVLYVSLYWATWLTPLWTWAGRAYRGGPAWCRRAFDAAAVGLLTGYDRLRGVRKYDTAIESVHDWFGVPQRSHHTPDELIGWMKERGFEGRLVIPKNGRFKSTSLFGVLGTPVGDGHD